MKEISKKKFIYIWNTTIFPSILCFLLLLGLYMGVNKFNHIRKEQSKILTEQAIRKASLQCYANEGMFPSNISYLEEYYNLSIDYDNYYIIYESIASNFFPQIGVYSKK